MECLRDYIGIAGCGADVPISGKYVNSLPGINSVLAAKIADSEQVTYLRVFEDVQNRALKKFETSVIAAFRREKHYRIKSINQVVDLGRKIIASDITIGTAQYRGFSIELFFPGNIYSLESSLQVIWVDSISLYSTEIVAGFSLKIFDLETGLTLDTITQNLVVGWNRITVEQSYDSLRIFIAYDASEFDSVKLDINPYSSQCCQYCADYIFGIGECEAQVRGRVSDDLSDPIEGEYGTNAFGLSGIFSVRCRYDWLVCNNKDFFFSAWHYLLGSELLTENLWTPRMNSYTNDKTDPVALRDYFLQEFDKELAIAITGIDISEQDCCVECLALIQKPMLLP